MLTASIIGTLVGGATSLVPGILDFFKNIQDIKSQTELKKIELEYLKETANIDVAKAEAIAKANERKHLLKHDSSIDPTGFIGGLRASVRPVITYVFFILFLVVKVLSVYVFFISMSGDPSISPSVFWNEMVLVVWDENTQAIFGAVIGFWFGGRMVEKFK